MKDRLRQWLSSLVYGGASLFALPLAFTAKPVLIFAPHADDETFGCGGLIALKVVAGASVHIVILTDGGLAAEHHPELRGDLVARRRREAIAAAAALGVPAASVEFLSFLDGGLNKLSGSDWADAADQLTVIIKKHRPAEVFVPHRRDRHGDHEAAFRLVKEALERARLSVRLFEYPIWLVWWSHNGRHLRLRDLARPRVVAIDGVRSRKEAAIQAYVSQQQVLPPGFLKSFSSRQELFFESDAFDGLAARDFDDSV